MNAKREALHSKKIKVKSEGESTHFIKQRTGRERTKNGWHDTGCRIKGTPDVGSKL